MKWIPYHITMACYIPIIVFINWFFEIHFKSVVFTETILLPIAFAYGAYVGVTAYHYVVKRELRKRGIMA